MFRVSDTILRIPCNIIPYYIGPLVVVSSLAGCVLPDPDEGLVLGAPFIIHNAQASKYSTQADILYEVLAGELSGHLGDIQQALQHYLRAADLTDDPAVAARATRIAMFARDWTMGLRAANRWSELASDNLEASQVLGVLELRNGNVDRALPHFEKIMSIAEDSPAKGFSIVGAILASESDVYAALRLLEKLMQKHFENPYGHLALAGLAFKAGDFQRAINESETALGFKPDLVEARTMRAQALINIGKTDQALREMVRAIEEAPDNREMRKAYAHMLLTAERYDEAAREFEALLAETPNDDDLIYTLGLLRFQQEKYDVSQAKFNRLIQRGQRKDESRYYLGRIEEEQGNLQAAVNEFQQVGHGQYYMSAKARIAGLYVEIDGLKKAQQYLRGLRNDIDVPENIVELYLIEGQLLHDEKLYTATMDLYSKGLQEFPGHSDLLYARALIAEKIDRIDLLEIDLKAILSEDPDNASALNALGYTLADRNFRINEAFGYIKRALEIRPNDPAVIDSMGWVQFRLGNYVEAESYLRKAYGLLEDAEISGHWFELLWAKGDYAEARKIMEKALQSFPDDEYLLELQKKIRQ